MLFSFPAELDPAAITSAGSYIILSHLLRSPTKLTKDGQIVGDLIEKWEVDKTKTQWKFFIKKDSYFSDGNQITSTNFVESYNRQVRMNTAIHFNFAKIKSISIINIQEFEIKLKTPIAGFLFDLAKPEFGVLPSVESTKDINKLTFKITSGPYHISHLKKDDTHLEVNSYYPESENIRPLLLTSGSSKEMLTNLKNAKIDFCVPFDTVSEFDFKQVESNKNLKIIHPHIGFSYWLSLNPKSSKFKSKAERTSFQSMFISFKGEKSFKTKFLTKANQIYLPDGDGRPSDQELKIIWNDIAKAKFKPNKGKKIKLKILPLKFENELTSEVYEFLSINFEIEILKYSSEEELRKIIKNNEFDIKISANDFSSIDLEENLKTSLNKSRPYLFLDEKSDVFKLMEKLSVENQQRNRSELFKQISITLLKDGNIIPLGYTNVYFYMHKDFNIEKWSNFFPEISFWKVP